MAATIAGGEIVEGKEFHSLSELEEAVERYQTTNFVQLYKRDTKTIVSLQKKNTKRPYNTQLKYGYLVYACIMGGRPFKSLSTGIRPNVRYVKS
jgi:zinc finger SWIM domain-containing protein 3